MCDDKRSSDNREIIAYGPSGSMRVGVLPEGCKRCIIGEKIVLYATGHCSVGCAYCPIPEDKKRLNDVYINERSVTLDENGLNTIINESQLCLASGSGITGGDPLEVPERIFQYIRYLKNKFGSNYHIHLYTSGVFFINNLNLIDELFDAGLDELRFHPKQIKSKRIWDLAAYAKARFPEKQIGFEIPCIPKQEDIIEELIYFADKNILDFVNLNEYEFTSSNFNKLSSRGFISVLVNAAIEGSQKTAQTVMEKVKNNTSITVHYCSSSSKDSIQLVKRFKKRASQIKRPFDEISDEGELEYGRFIVNTKEKVDELTNLLVDEYELDPDMFQIFGDTLSIETAWYVVETITTDLRKNHFSDLQAEIIARHPIENGPITWVDSK